MVNTLTSPATFKDPMHATLSGRSVTILAVGNIEGKSPCYLYVDSNGKTDWESIGKFTVIDTRMLPLSEDALQNLSRALTNQQAVR